MRCGIVLQQEYHKRYGATNGVVSRHTYFGPLKKKHGILVSLPSPPRLALPSPSCDLTEYSCEHHLIQLQTVAGNVRLCDIQPGDGFGEEDGGADAELTEEAQAAVEEQKEEKKRKKGTGLFSAGAVASGSCLA